MWTASSDVDGIVQQLVEPALVEALAVAVDEAFGGQFPDDGGGRAGLGEGLEDVPDLGGLGLVDDQLAVLHPVAERRPAAHPHALLAGGGELVANALADHLPLELGEGEQDVEGELAHRGGGAELLGDRDEGDALPVEHLHQLGEVHERAAEAVDLVDDDDVDRAGLDVGQQAAQCRPFQRAAREAAIIVAVGDEEPAFRLLAGDIGLARLALGIEGVELHVQPFLGGLAGVNRAAALQHDARWGGGR